MSAESSFRSRVESRAPEGSIVDGVVEGPDGLRYLSPLRAGAFLGLLRAGADLDERLNAKLESQHGVNLRAFEILLFLAVFAPEGTLRMSQLTEHAPLSQSRVSRLVSELEAKGLVRRTPAETDGRGVSVSITDRGLETFKTAQETHLRDLEQWLFSRLTETEIRQLAKITEKIIGAS